MSAIEKNRVLVIEAGGWGGVCHYAYNLLQALSQEEDLRVSLLTDIDYELENLKRDFQLIKVRIKDQAYPKVAYRIVKQILKARPRLIHLQSLVSARKDWFLFVLARLFGFPVIFTAHNVLPHEEEERSAFFVRSAFKIIYHCSRRIIVHTRYSKEKLAALFKIDPQKILVIPHGNYLFMRVKEVSRQEAKENLGLPQDKKVILQFGAIRPYKGIDALLYAFRRFHSIHQNTLLLIAGPLLQGDEAVYRNLIRELGLEEGVFFKPQYIPMKDLPLYYFCADLVVLPYRGVDMSGSLQLAYAFSKPVIAAKVGGLPEAVEDQRNGLLVEPDNAGALEEALEKLLFAPDLITRMGEASFGLARDKFSWEPIAAQTAGLYRIFCHGRSQQERS